MTLKTNKLRNAISYALVSTTALAGTGVAFAQDQGDNQDEELDRIEIVGSRIKRADTDTSQPVFSLRREEIEAQGLTSVGDVIQNITANGSTLNSTFNNGGNGETRVSLRSLGSNRTLVLVNGRRWVGGTGLGGAVDLNTIPTAAVERIEVLKDGASAIYGSDAIAGVINIITRSNFDGAEASAYFGGYTKGDGFQQAYDFTVGADSDRWNVVFNIAYTDQEPVFQGDREISAVPVFGGGDIESGGAFGSGSPARGNFTRCATALTPTPSGFLTCTPVAGGPFTLRPGEDGRQATDFRRFISYTVDGSGSSDRYNFAPVNYLVQPIERFNIYTQGTLRLTDRLNANVMATYVKRDSTQQLAEVPLTMDTRGTTGPQWAFAPTAGNVFNPFAQNLRGMNFRSIAVGPRTNVFDIDNIAVTGWLDGSFDLGGRAMYWDAGYSYLNARFAQNGQNYINLFNLRRAVGDSRRNPVTGRLECMNGTAVIAGCVPFNLFGGADLGLGAGVISREEYDAMIDYISYDLNQLTETTTHDYFANLSGEIVEMPAGPLGFAIGAEHRKTDFNNMPDALVAGGGSSNNFQEPTNGEVSVEELYAELNIPVLADIPGFKLLEFNLAARRSDYDSTGFFGGTTVTPDIGGDTSGKFGFKWQIFDDVLVRGTYSESFRAPSVGDLFQGGTENFPTAADPCNTFNIGALSANDRARCLADGVPAGGVAQANAQIRSLNGGNPLLKPELGKTRSLGVVYSPSWAEGLNFTLDWYQIKMTDIISFRGAQAMLNGCYRSGVPLTSPPPLFCSFVQRDATGEILELRQTSFNQNFGIFEGYDFSVAYAMPETAWGKFSFQWDTTYQSQVATAQTQSGPNGLDSDGQQTVGTYNGAPTFRIRSNITTNWQKGDWDATWSMRYYSALDEQCPFGANYFEYGITPTELCNNDIFDPNGSFNRGENRIGSRIYHDVQVGWKTPWNGKVIAGARNIFAKDPPITRNSFAGSFDAAYDLPEGGFWYLQYNQKF